MPFIFNFMKFTFIPVSNAAIGVPTPPVCAVSGRKIVDGGFSCLCDILSSINVLVGKRLAGHDRVDPAHGIGNRRVDGRETLGTSDTPGHGANLRESTDSL